MNILLSNRYMPDYEEFGMLISPACHNGLNNLGKCPFSIDNGIYSAWANNQVWKPIEFLELLYKVPTYTNQAPEWVVVPDAVADAKKTLELWKSGSRLSDHLVIPALLQFKMGTQLSVFPRMPM